jgi:hypothetical protein
MDRDSSSSLFGGGDENMGGATEVKGATDTMNSLAELAINAHGGLDRWRQFEKVSADLAQGGVLRQVKGQAGTLDKTNVTVGLRSERER